MTNLNSVLKSRDRCGCRGWRKGWSVIPQGPSWAGKDRRWDEQCSPPPASPPHVLPAHTGHCPALQPPLLSPLPRPPSPHPANASLVPRSQLRDHLQHWRISSRLGLTMKLQGSLASTVIAWCFLMGVWRLEPDQKWSGNDDCSVVSGSLLCCGL